MSTMLHRCLRFVLLLLCLGAPAMADGLIVVRDAPQGPRSFAPLAIKYHHVTVRITDQIATTEVDQVFVNPGDRRLEGTYLFPIPKNAQIDSLMMDVNGRMQAAELLDAAKARAIYEDIVRKALDPALLEYVGQGLFRMRIFPIEPHSEKRVRLAYTQLLTKDHGLIAYTYPLNTEKFSSQPLESVSIQVSLSAGQPLKAVYSPSHEIEIRRKDARHATLGFESKGVKPDTDFQLMYSLQAEPGIGLNLLTYRDADDPEGYFLLLASPPAASEAARIMDKDVVFVLDSSGSMAEGGKLAQARKALGFCLANLNAGDRFEIVRFSTEAEPLFDKLVAARAAHLEKAQAFLQGVKPIGGTAIDEALATALRHAKGSDPARPLVLIFLTDGRPTVGTTDDQAILARALKAAGGRTVRIFCFGIGTDVNTHLLDGLAEGTRAASQYVLPTENLETKVSSFYAKISNPVLANPRMDLSGGVRVSKLQPEPLPDLFQGDQLIVVGRYREPGDASVSLSGTVQGETRTFREKVAFARQSTQHAFLPRLWATRRIGFLLDEIRLHGERAELRDEITDLARRHGIVTPYTAYLIVEDEARRGVPVEYRMLREEEALAVRTAGSRQYKGVTSSRSGELAVGGAQAFDVLKRARTAEAPAAASVAAQKALTGAEAQEGARLQTALNAQARRTLAGRTFYRTGERWIEASLQSRSGDPAIRIRFGSSEYFALLSSHPDAAQWLSVGRQVRFQLNGTLYDIVD